MALEKADYNISDDKNDAVIDINGNSLSSSESDKVIRRVGSCGNCTRILRKQPCCLKLFSRFNFFLVATGVIQVTLFCVFLLDPHLGVYNNVYNTLENLPTLSDCGNPESNFKPSYPVFVVLVVLNFAQMIISIFQIIVTFFFVRQMQFRTVVLQYFLLALSFAGHFATSAFWSAYPWWYGKDDDPGCSLLFSFPGSNSGAFLDDYINGGQLYVTAFYFSTETITSVGYGDISPNSPFTRIVCGVEMFVGLFFSVFIVSGALEKFAQPVAPDETGFGKLQQRIINAKRDRKLHVHLSARLLFVRIRDNRIVRSVRRFFRKLHVLVSLIVELCAMSLLVLYRTRNGNYGINDVFLLVIVLVLQGIVFLFNMVVSLKYVRRVNEVSISFLFQSLVSTVVDFGCLYTSLCYTNRDWNHDGENGHKKAYEMPFTACPEFVPPPLNQTLVNNQTNFENTTKRVIGTMISFIYFSFVTITTTGFGSLVPTQSFSRILVCVEMYLAVLYSSVIFGLGLSRYFGTSTTDEGEDEEEENVAEAQTDSNEDSATRSARLYQRRRTQATIQLFSIQKMRSSYNLRSSSRHKRYNSTPAFPQTSMNNLVGSYGSGESLNSTLESDGQQNQW